MFSWFLAPAGAQEVTVSLSVGLDIIFILGQVLPLFKNSDFLSSSGSGSGSSV